MAGGIQNVLIVVYLLIVLAMIGVILLQRSEGGGLGMGSSNSNGLISVRGSANLLTRTTAILAALFFVGASDMVSVVTRSSILQLATPQEMRGRVSAVNSLFIGASNELGEFESGLTASWWGAVRAAVYGGIGSLVITGLWSVLFPNLRRADQLTAEALLQVEAEEAVQEMRKL